jgi:hypothetical protein
VNTCSIKRVEFLDQLNDCQRLKKTFVPYVKQFVYSKEKEAKENNISFKTAEILPATFPDLVYLRSRWLTCCHNTFSSQPDSTTRAIW